ncbi:hypothetical protein TTHERM_00939120 (macronuclear) [Tetrahymena thermophila SB210]|uniref:Uncharacterized protein n=1 Tax=Tetrahymena thermophila (strain SB210) TaxID=312017 RepID=Q22DN1_TETTS|nr:hypothetical protein TTHERM_00939120 [Tetrahymena thermophila SB210]EAR83423.1 hypothetical protein TTHERM_00939120 [Tetrahymena thermophila SB210]|eukprot:XP_001031086.1 hypothetical protein TTHERM_00939120 [Tetrahymena thermophila SB210]
MGVQKQISPNLLHIKSNENLDWVEKIKQIVYMQPAKDRFKLDQVFEESNTQAIVKAFKIHPKGSRLLIPGSATSEKADSKFLKR